jgi:ribonuclease VapC
LSVLDASALLAFLHGEPGADLVADVLALGDAEISAVNWCEVLTKFDSLGMGAEEAVGRMESRGLTVALRIVPFDEHQARLAASLHRTTRALGLSLADRVCLSLGIAHDATVFTADRSWLEAGLSSPGIRVIR